MARAITMIPATKNKFTAAPINAHTKRRTAGYARVSTDSEEQQTSYEAQVDYYTSYIKSRDDWEFIDVYTDEGISATNTKHRKGFNQMIQDALYGRIDLIVTKSVSRFARNTVDSLVTVRKLKEKGVEVYFEKENIYTLDSKGELLITIMSSLAQEESRSISENITWGQRKRFSDGKVCMPYKRFLGYDKGENGMPVVNEAEATVVRLIYKLYLDGKTPAGICKYLDEAHIPTPAKKAHWSQTTVESILKNEKYKGDALLQKSFTVDFLTKTTKVNEGEVPQYYVKGSHPAIIEPIEFDMVQAEIARRKRIGNYYSGNSVFSSKLICGDCGGFYGQKVWHSTDAYRRVIWQCNGKFKKKKKCSTPHLTAEQIQQAFLKAYNIMMGGRDDVIADCEFIRSTLSNYTELGAEIAKWQDEVDIVADFIKKCIQDNASAAQSQDEYCKRYDGFIKRYEKAKAKYEALISEKTRRTERDMELKTFIDGLRNNPLVLDAWNEHLWTAFIEKGTVFADGSIEFEFKNGTTIKVESD